MEESRPDTPDTPDEAPRESDPRSGAPGVISAQRQLEERLSRISDGDTDTTERLLFWLDGRPYSAALTALREALPELPTVTALPFSPSWLIGLFPLRTDLITLIDPRPFLEGARDALAAGGQIALPDSGQALLIGKADRLIAFVVDRIGDITSVSAPAAPSPDEETARQDSAARYVEFVHPPDGESHASVMALNLAALYEDVLGELEVWSRDA